MPETRGENRSTICPILTRRYDGAGERPLQWQSRPAGKIFSEIV